jgi:hypothetical protein
MTTRRAALVIALGLFVLPTPAFPLDAPAKRVEATGKSESGLLTRIVAEAASFKAGHPIPLRVELSNTGQKPVPYTQVSPTSSQSLAVTDADGKPVPFLAGPAAVPAHQVFLDPGQTVDVESFDLSKWFYLRRPGRYAVAIRDSVSIPATERLQFEIIPDPAAGADGDPVGRLLPLVQGREHWTFVAPPNHPARMRPGLNRAEVPARVMIFQYAPPNATIRDIRSAWFWLADEESPEQAAAADAKWPPATESLGKIGRWHVYSTAPADAVKQWPTLVEDVRKALEGGKP